jgi:hypothetical protein
MANQQDLRFAREMAQTQREQVRIQEEYNEAIKMSSSLNRQLQSDIDDAVNTNADLGDTSRGYLNELKSSISELSSSKDISKLLVQIEKDRLDIQSNSSNLSAAEQTALLASLDIARRSLNIEEQRVLITEKVNEAATKLSETMGGMFDGLLANVKEIPVIGKMLGGLGDIGTKMLKEKLSNAAMKFTTDFRAGLDAGKGTMEALSGAAGGLGSSLAFLANPYVLLAAAVLAVAAVGVLAFYKMSAAAKQFRTETGLLNSQTKDLEAQIGRVYATTAPLGASMEDVSLSATAFSKEFSGIEMASDEVLGSMVTLNKNFGVGVEEASKLNKVFQNIGGLSAEQSQILIGQTVQMAKLANVAPSQVIKDMAESSEYAYRYFQGSPAELAKAAVQAAKLGTSIGEAGKVADNLLDFQNSITSELEAGAILGTNLNLGQARYLAANNKILSAQQSVIEQVANLGDLTKLNTFEQDALVKATGMSMETLINQQRIKEQFGKLNEEELATAMQVLKAGGDISKMGKADLAAKTKELALQQEMQTSFDKSANALNAIGSEFMIALMPIGKFLMDTLIVAISYLKGGYGTIAKAFGNLVDAVSRIFKPFADLFGTSGGSAIAATFEFIGKIIGSGMVFAFEYIAGVVGSIADMIGGVFKILKGIFTLDFGLVMEGLGQGLKGIFGMIFRFPIAIFQTLTDMFPKLMGAITEWFTSLGSRIKTFFSDLLPDWAKRFIGGATGSASTGLQTDTAAASSTESINDGVVQDGKVVSTNPADTIFAMKKPEDLANGMSSVQSAATIDISALVSKMDEMIQAVSQNRDVYMDREKVSSAVVTTSEKSSQNRFGLMGA